MSIQVMYYGMLAEITGQASEAWLVNENLTVEKLRTQIWDKYPAMREKKFKIAVNKHISEDSLSIPEQAEIALLPPFAGG